MRPPNPSGSSVATSSAASVRAASAAWVFSRASRKRLSRLSPLGWEHIALTGTYRWDLTAKSTLEDLPNENPP